ncbi:hypothetical protein [Pseudomonas caspiana]|nr:hypothetical protein [Pseudomonas caspiana]
MTHINKSKYFSFTAKKSLLAFYKSATFALRKDCPKMLQESAMADAEID